MQTKNEPILIFLALVFVLSIPFWILETAYPIQLLPGLPLSALGVLAPTLAALILVYKNERLAGVLQLLRRSFDFKRIKNGFWFLAILLINPLITLLAYGAIRIADPSLPYPGPLTPGILPIFIFFFIGALAEEIGWSGYATEPLLRRYGTLVTGLALGLVWAVWHFIPLMQAQRSPEWIAWWSLGTVLLRMIMTWLYSRSGGSVFAAAIFHALINLCWQLFPNNGSFYDPRVFGLITFAFAVVILIADQFSAKNPMQTA